MHPATRIDDVVARLAELRAGGLWPTGPRALWTDAFGLMLLVSLYRRTGEARYLVEARSLVTMVEDVLRRDEERRLDLAAWILALGRLARIEPEYRRHAVVCGGFEEAMSLGFFAKAGVDDHTAAFEQKRLGASQALGVRALVPLGSIEALVEGRGLLRLVRG